ncbi:hypothetical protein V5O48_018376 [Marasmius crinis-equi]|uniref:BTB domain-containing protein n=1 Tax=Marasmius crinis-equi TaxID=585013 RepID=A0ABR3ELC6_9AGAR
MFKNDLAQSCSAATPNKNFFLASVTFKVGNELFQLPKFLFPSSNAFNNRYPAFSQDHRDNPVVLSDCSPAQFQAFLTVILQPLTSIFPGPNLFPLDHPSHQPLDLESVLSALDLATKWGFQDTRDDLQDKARYFLSSPRQKISLGRRYKLLSWFREGLEELVKSDEDISLEDADVIGLAFALRVYHARSGYARARATTLEDQAFLSESESLKIAIEDVFARELESLLLPAPDDTINDVVPLDTTPDPVYEAVSPPHGAGNSSSSFVSVAADLNSSTVGSDGHASFDHHDYSTDEEFYTRPPSVFVEDSVFGDSVLADGSSAEEITVTADEGLVVKNEGLTLEPVTAIFGEEAVSTPRPPIVEDPRTPLTPHPPPPPSAPAQPLSFLPPPTPLRIRSPVIQPRPFSAPPIQSPVKPSLSTTTTTPSLSVNASTAVHEDPPSHDQSPTVQPKAPSPVVQDKPQPPVVQVKPQPPPAITSTNTNSNTKAKPSTSITASTPAPPKASTSTPQRDDALIRDLLRCILDPQLPMPARVAAGVPKTCNSPSSECSNTVRCDPCCHREARKYLSKGWVPKANTSKGQVFLDAHLRPSGATGGGEAQSITVLKDTLKLIPKKGSCKKGDKKCGSSKRCLNCCEIGVREMLQKGEII